MNCGGCVGLHSQCNTILGQCECIPHTCVEHGWGCGGHDNGCGQPLDCGVCQPGYTCWNNATCAVDGCTPTQICADFNPPRKCGTYQTTCQENGAPLTIDCGFCRGGASCTNFQCSCTPTRTCQTEGYICGSFRDDCAQIVDCGGCPPSDYCEASTRQCLANNFCGPNQRPEFGACVCVDGYSLGASGSCESTLVGTSESASAADDVNVGILIGIFVAVAVVLLLVVGGICFLIRRQSKFNDSVRWG